MNPWGSGPAGRCPVQRCVAPSAATSRSESAAAIAGTTHLAHRRRERRRPGPYTSGGHQRTSRVVDQHEVDVERCRAAAHAARTSCRVAPPATTVTGANVSEGRLDCVERSAGAGTTTSATACSSERTSMAGAAARPASRRSALGRYRVASRLPSPAAASDGARSGHGGGRSRATTQRLTFRVRRRRRPRPDGRGLRRSRAQEARTSSSIV